MRAEMGNPELEREDGQKRQGQHDEDSGNPIPAWLLPIRFTPHAPLLHEAVPA